MAVLRAVEQSRHTFLTAYAQISRKEPHSIFAGGERYVPPTLRGEIDRAAFAELTAAGLTHGDKLRADLVDAFEILDHPDVLVHAHVRNGEEQYGVLVARLDRDGVVVTCRGDRVRLGPLPSGVAPATVLVRALPRRRAARFTPFSVAEHDSRSEEALRLKEILDAPSSGFGDLHAGTGRRLSYLDTDDGRVGLARTGPSENRYLSVFPGDQLASRL